MTHLLPVEFCDKNLRLRDFEILRAKINLRTVWFVTCRNILEFVWLTTRRNVLTARALTQSATDCCKLYRLQPCGLLFWGSKHHKHQSRYTGSSDQVKFHNCEFCPDYPKHRYKVQSVSLYAVICFISLLLNRPALTNGQHFKINVQAGQISNKTNQSGWKQHELRKAVVVSVSVAGCSTVFGKERCAGKWSVCWGSGTKWVGLQ